MVRHSTPQWKIDDQAFPVRVKIAVPPGGLGNVLNDMIYWLQDNLGRGNFAQHAAGSVGLRDAAGFYFRSLDDAQRFMDTFPAAELADGTASPGYTSPAIPNGRQ